MTPNEFVKLYMQNCQYRKELSLMAAAVAEENGLVVVFGASDDICEIRGAEDDEIDCFDGGEATIAGAKVKINWCKDGYSWTYDTDIPHECFDVYEDGEKYCRGIVFSISDVRLPAADAVEVVRCKDCKWYKVSKLLAPDKFCFRLKDGNGNHVGYNFVPDDFCSHGERKDEDDNNAR